MNDFEQRVAEVIAPVMYPQLASRMEGAFNAANSQQKRRVMDATQAALKAHSDWLAEQGLVVVPKGLPNTDATGQYIIPPSAAHQQEE